MPGDIIPPGRKRMNSTWRVLGMGLLSLLGEAAWAQTSFPNRPIRIVTAEPGGATDTAARLIAQGLGAKLGQPAIVDNRGGAGGTLAAQVVAKSPADGHTLLFYSDSFWTAPLVRDNVAFDPLKDFAPVTLAVFSPNVLVVHPSLPVKSVKELIALAKARPGELNYGSGSTGSVSHLSAELLNVLGGIKVVRVPFKGAGPGLIALMSGQVHLMFPSASSGWPLAKAGKLRALGVSSPQPSSLTPGLPTMIASGLPGFESANTNAMFAPAKTPAAVIMKLQQEISAILREDSTRDRLTKSGLEIVGGTPEALAATVRAELIRWGRVIKEAGIRAE